MLQDKDCEATEQLVSEIMNEIILRMGVGSPGEESFAQLQHNINQLSDIRGSMREYKFRKQLDQECGLETQIEVKLQEVQDIEASLKQQRELKENGFELVRTKFADKVRQEMFDKESRQLNKNKRYLSSILARLQEMKTNLQRSKEDTYANSSAAKTFNDSLQQLYIVSQKMSEQFKESTVSMQQQLVKLKTDTQCVTGKIQSQKSILNVQRQLKLKIKQGRSIQRNIDYNVLNIKNSTKKLGQSDQSILHVKELIPTYPYKDQAVIYISAVLFFLLVHYVFK